MAMKKLRAFTKKVLNANGPAQIVSYSLWGVLVSGMLWDYCDGCLPNELLLIWGALSLMILPIAIWCSKHTLKLALISDMVLSTIVLFIYLMHEPHFVTQMVYQVKSSGEFVKTEHSISEWSTVIALIWMALHSGYLANLIQRQQLEQERFRNEF